MKEKIIKALSSRTVWTVILLGLFNALESIKDLVPTEAQIVITAVLAFLSVYFKLFPSQKY